MIFLLLICKLSTANKYSNVSISSSFMAIGVKIKSRFIHEFLEITEFFEGFLITGKTGSDGNLNSMWSVSKIRNLHFSP